MEASALTHASKRGLLARRSPVLRLQGDERLVAMIREGHARAFEVLFDRYNARLQAFCHHMLSSKEDAEDVLQEVFVAAHRAMLADNRAINVRPWLYRIARNRCLNHLRRPVPEGQDSMDIHPHENGATTLERVQNREEFRRLLADVKHLPETQRTALLLREVDALSYEEIAQSMETTVPSVKSLLVRARITLAEASQARLLTCGEVQLELAEAAEGLRKASGPVRQHVRGCEPCGEFRSQLRQDSKALAALAPIGALALLKEAVVAKLSGLFGGGTSTAGGGAAATGGATAGGAAAGGSAVTASALSGAAGSAAGGVGGVLGAKAAAGVATAALLTAGAVEVHNYVGPTPDTTPAPKSAAADPAEAIAGREHHAVLGNAPTAAPTDAKKELVVGPEPDPAADQAGDDAGTTPPADVPPADDAAAGEPAASSDPAGDQTDADSGPTVTTDVPVTPAASYTWTTGTVVEVPSGGEEPPSEAPPVDDPPPPPPPPPAE